MAKVSIITSFPFNQSVLCKIELGSDGDDDDDDKTTMAMMVMVRTRNSHQNQPQPNSPSHSTLTRKWKHHGFSPSSFRPAAVIDTYFLVYLAGRIDHGHHDGKAVKALNDAKAMNEAVENAMKLVDKGQFYTINCLYNLFLFFQLVFSDFNFQKCL